MFISGLTLCSSATRPSPDGDTALESPTAYLALGAGGHRPQSDLGISMSHGSLDFLEDMGFPKAVGITLSHWLFFRSKCQFLLYKVT